MFRFKKKFPLYKQHDSMDCGPTCLRMIASFYGKNYTLDFLKELCFITKEGVFLLGIHQAAEKIGFSSIGVNIPLNVLIKDIPPLVSFIGIKNILLYFIA